MLQYGVHPPHLRQVNEVNWWCRMIVRSEPVNQTVAALNDKSSKTVKAIRTSHLARMFLGAGQSVHYPLNIFKKGGVARVT